MLLFLSSRNDSRHTPYRYALHSTGIVYVLDFMYKPKGQEGLVESHLGHQTWAKVAVTGNGSFIVEDQRTREAKCHTYPSWKDTGRGALQKLLRQQGQPSLFIATPEPFPSQPFSIQGEKNVCMNVSELGRVLGEDRQVPLRYWAVFMHLV